MNNDRRKQLKEIIKRLDSLKESLESVLADEEIAFDSMPEGLQGTTNGMNSEEAIDKMNEAVELLDEVIDCVNEIV